MIGDKNNMKHKHIQFEEMTDLSLVQMLHQVKENKSLQDADWIKDAEDELKFRDKENRKLYDK